MWAQECVARSRVFDDEVADRWDFGGLEDFDRFTEFMVRRKQRVIHLRDPRVHACESALRLPSELIASCSASAAGHVLL